MFTSVSECKTDRTVYLGFKLTNLTWNKIEHEKINLKEGNYNFQIPVSHKTSYNVPINSKLQHPLPGQTPGI